MQYYSLRHGGSLDYVVNRYSLNCVFELGPLLLVSLLSLALLSLLYVIKPAVDFLNFFCVPGGVGTIRVLQGYLLIGERSVHLTVSINREVRRQTVGVDSLLPL